MSNVKIDFGKMVRVYDVVCFACGHHTAYDPPKAMRLKDVTFGKCHSVMVSIISPDLGLPKEVDISITTRIDVEDVA
jgi:hypothetical protein